MQEEYKGYVIRVEFDDLAESPREWDNLGTMACFHRRRNLGDKHDFKNPQELDAFLKRKDVVSLPLYLYDHSDITIATTPFSCPWDSGQVGYIYVTHEAIRKEYSLKRVSKKAIAKAKTVLEGEVETYDQFLTGDVYFYTIFKPTEDDGDLEEIGGVHGFYGEDYCLQSAKEDVDAQILREKDEAVIPSPSWDI